MSNLNFKVRDNRTLILIGEVAEIVKNGRTIKVAKYDRLNEFYRYLNNNKRNMLLTGGSLAATAILSGPIGLACAAGGKLIMFVGGSIIQGFRLWRKSGKYKTIKETTLQQRQGTGGDIVWKREGNDLVFDTAYGDNLIEDVQYMLENKGLTDIYNAFANLDLDFKKFNKFAAGAFPPAGWKLGTFGAVRVVSNVDLGNIALLDTDTKATEQGVPDSSRINITTSDDAVELWETCCRIQYRYQQVVEAIEMLQEFVEYITASISVFDADAIPRSRRLWNTITDNGKKDAGVVLEILNGAGNRINRSWGFVTDFWRRVTGSSDYRAWACSLLPEHILKDAIGVQLALIKRTNPNQYKMIMQKVASNTYESAKGFVGFDPAEVTSPGAWFEYVSSVGIDAIGGVIQNKFAEEAEKTTTKKAALGGAFGKFYQAEAGIQAAIEAVAGVIVEAANKIWTEYQLKTGKTFGIKGVHQQSIESRIGLLRDLAKEEAEAYVEVIEAWKEGYDKSQTAASPEDAAEALLLYHSAEKAYYSNRTGQMLEEAVWSVTNLTDLANNFTANSAKAVEDFLTKDDEPFTGKGGQFYYGSLKKALEDMGYAIADQTLAKKAEDAPVIKVDGSNLLKETFADKSIFISNQIAYVPFKICNFSIFPVGCQPWALGMPTKEEFYSATSAGRGVFSNKTGETVLKGLYEDLQQLFLTMSPNAGKERLVSIQKKCDEWMSLMMKTKLITGIDALLSVYPQAKPVKYLKEASESKLAKL